LLDRAAYAPARGRYKIYMIDEVHMLSNTAFNAMLKTLEEPPEYLKFILATTDPQKIPVTVLSRCLQFSLKPMTVAQVSDYLAHVMTAENIPAEPLALSAIAKAAQGSMRDALSILDQAIAYGAGTVLAAGVQQMLGVADTSGIYALMQHLAVRDMTAALAQAQTLLDVGVPAANVLDEMANIASRLAVYAHTNNNQEPADPALATLVGQFTPEHLHLIYAIATKSQGDIAYAPNSYAALAMPLLRMQVFAPQAVSTTQAKPATLIAPVVPAIAVSAASTPHVAPVVIAAAAVAPQAVASSVLPAPMPAAIAAPKPMVEPVPPPSTAFALTAPEQWPAIANSLPLIATARMTARESACVKIDGLNLHLVLKSKQLADTVLVMRVQDALRALTGQQYVLHVNVLEVKDAAQAPVLQQTAVAQAEVVQVQRQTQAEQTFSSDPLVKALVSLGGSIVAGSVQAV
jgi:DNA polymerase III subunit gamma/tau